MHAECYPFLQWHFQVSPSEVHKAPFLQGFERHANDKQSLMAKLSSASSNILTFLLAI